MHKLVFLGALCCALGLSSKTYSGDDWRPWNGKIVIRYDTWKRGKDPRHRGGVREFAADNIDVASYREHLPKGSSARGICMWYLEFSAMSAAKRSRGADFVSVSDRSGECWQGEKPPQPLGWFGGTW